ncbi:MAG: ABC transporter permease [Chloroflexi bacterium]|nr:MAG: ABC transporter permease [Chloroflexota bacterium]
MFSYIIQRVLTAIPTLFLITVLGFVIMELPPGDYLTYYIQQLEAQGVRNAQEEAAALAQRYNLNEPAVVRFFSWLGRFVRGDFGESFEYRRPVRELIGERLALTVALAVASLLITWGIGIPIGVYSATHQYTWKDNLFTTVAFIGLGLPSFMLALIFLVFGFRVFGSVQTGLFSPAFESAPWSFAKLVDLLKHLWVPAAIVAVSGTAGIIRMMRGNLLDELRVNYVQAVRAKGVPERAVIWKHAVRNALHPLVMSFGMSLPLLVSGSELTGIILNLPTTGPLYLQAVRHYDTYLAGTMLILVAFMLVVGNLLADIVLAWLDPRIRYD